MQSVEYDPSNAFLDLSAIANVSARAAPSAPKYSPELRQELERLSKHNDHLSSLIASAKLTHERLVAQNEHISRLIADANRVNEGLKREHDLALARVRAEAARR